MWINDKVIYTPEIVETRHGAPVQATVTGVSALNAEITIVTTDGVTHKVNKKQCKPEKVS